jgi:chemotaxis protein methyltransferase CheR
MSDTKFIVHSIGNVELKAFLDTIQEAYGYDFTNYSQASIKRRITSYMSTFSIGSLEALRTVLLSDESSFESFIQHVSVTVTEMFRDPAFYQSLRQNVIPRLATYPHIKIWIAGCATGEEVYSVAIVLAEENLLDRTIIYATDINQKSLQMAKDGIYPMSQMQMHTKNYLLAGGKKSFSKYYKAKYHWVLMDRSLMNKTVFASHNLVTDKSFNEFQLILCRNVMIYFNQSLQNQVLNLFYESLCQFGFIGLGNKESMLFYDGQKKFDIVDKKEKIYIKTR